jgi:hypothetical protein
MGIEEEAQAKGICNMSKKIMAEILPNLKKELSIQVQNTSRTPNRLGQNRTSPQQLLLKQLAQRKEKEY